MTDIFVSLDATQIGGTIIPGGAEARKIVGSTGVISVKGIDAPSYLQAGAKFIQQRTMNQTLVAAPRAASAGRVVTSTTLANGTLSIANQPDVPRQLVLVVDPGAAAITAGNAALTYVANDGLTTVDNVSVVTPTSTIKSVTTSKGVISLTSVIVTAVAGGSTPGVQVNDTNSLSMEVSPYFSSFTLRRAYADGAVNGTTAVASSAASYTPSTTPNGTHTYSALASVTSP
jgi:hypothetical protein